MATGFTDTKSRKSEEQRRDGQIHEPLSESGRGRLVIIHTDHGSEHIVAFGGTFQGDNAVAFQTSPKDGAVLAEVERKPGQFDKVCPTHRR